MTAVRHVLRDAIFINVSAMFNRGFHVSRKPFDLIHKNLDNDVEVYLRDGRMIRGRMVGYDKDLNIALADATSQKGETTRDYKRLVLRRNNILSIGKEGDVIWEEE
ncbi:hypothetical protein EF808_06335 [archaeon]|nr:MAG: hypothetical protein EF808_06335 [archaeon]